METKGRKIFNKKSFRQIDTNDQRVFHRNDSFRLENLGCFPSRGSCSSSSFSLFHETKVRKTVTFDCFSLTNIDHHLFRSFEFFHVNIDLSIWNIEIVISKYSL